MKDQKLKIYPSEEGFEEIYVTACLIAEYTNPAMFFDLINIDLPSPEKLLFFNDKIEELRDVMNNLMKHQNIMQENEIE